MRNFLVALSNDDLDAGEYLDLRNLTGEAAAIEPSVLAEMFYVILTRKTHLKVETLSRSLSGADEEGVPSYRDLMMFLETSRGEIPLFLQRVPEPNGSRVWKVSNQTVNEIPFLYEQFGYSGWIAQLKDTIPPSTLAGIETFKWAAIVGIMFATWLPVYLLGRWIATLLGRRRPDLQEAYDRFFRRPLPLLLAALAGTYMLNYLGQNLASLRISESRTTITIVITWALIAGVNLLRDLYRGHLISKDRQTTVPMLNPLANSIKAIILVLAVLMWLNNLGYDVTALLAGLGVGGLAVALVLQKPLEDLFGAMTLYLQQPVQVGDFFTAGAITGTIEEIGLRTTRIRTLANSVVSVPNAKIAAEAIDNLSAREKILYRPMIPLSYETTQHQIETILAEVKKLFASNASVIDESARVRFTTFGTYALELHVFAYIDTHVYAEYLEITEKINLAIMGIVEAAGTELVRDNLVLEGQSSA